MLTKVETRAEYNLLPSSIRHIIAGGMGKISKAERAYALQNVVANAVKEQWISLDLAIEILKANFAYGKRGKEVLEPFQK